MCSNLYSASSISATFGLHPRLEIQVQGWESRPDLWVHPVLCLCCTLSSVAWCSLFWFTALVAQFSSSMIGGGIKPSELNLSHSSPRRRCLDKNSNCLFSSFSLEADHNHPFVVCSCGDVSQPLYANLNQHFSLYVQYYRHRPHFVFVVFFWRYRFHRAPATSKEMSIHRSTGTKACFDLIIRCLRQPFLNVHVFFLSLLKCIPSCRLQVGSCLSQNKYLNIKNTRLLSTQRVFSVSAVTVGCHWASGLLTCVYGVSSYSLSCGGLLVLMWLSVAGLAPSFHSL